MRIRAIAMAAVVFLAATSSLAAQHRVEGAAVVERSASLTDVFTGVIPLALTQADVDYLIASMDPVVAWAAEHREEWDAVGQPDGDELALVRQLDVWRSTGVSSADFVAALVKVQTARQLATQGYNVDLLRQQLTMAEEALASGEVPAEQREGVEQQLSTMRGLIVALEAYPEENLAVYETNAEALDTALNKFNAVSGDQAP